MSVSAWIGQRMLAVGCTYKKECGKVKLVSTDHSNRQVVQLTSKGFTTAEFDGQFGKFLTREEQDFDIGQFLDRLRYHPQQWARYPEPVHRPTVIERIRRHHWPNQIPGEFQVKSATTEPGSDSSYKWMYVRYIGPGPEEADWLPPRPIGVTLDFQDPPAKTGRAPSKVRLFLEQVKHYPGVWCRLKDPIVGSLSTAIIRGVAYGQKPGSFDAVARTITDSDTSAAPGKLNTYLYVMFLEPALQAGIPGGFDPIPETERLFIFEICPAIHKRAAYKRRKMEEHPFEGSRSAVGTWLDQTVRHMPGDRWAMYPWPWSSKVPRAIEDATMYGARDGEFETRTTSTFDRSSNRVKLLMARKREAFRSELTFPSPRPVKEMGPDPTDLVKDWPLFDDTDLATRRGNRARSLALTEAGLIGEVAGRSDAYREPVRRYSAVQLHMVEHDPDMDEELLDRHVRTLTTPGRREEFLEEITMSAMLCGIEVLPVDFGPLDEDGVPFGPRLEKWLEWELPPDPWI